MMIHMQRESTKFSNRWLKYVCLSLIFMYAFSCFLNIWQFSLVTIRRLLRELEQGEQGVYCELCWSRKIKSELITYTSVRLCN